MLALEISLVLDAAFFNDLIDSSVPDPYRVETKVLGIPTYRHNFKV